MNYVDRSTQCPISFTMNQPYMADKNPSPAFILYRQHHQANVVAQHPGLANPEISKIIGDHWRSSPLEVKNHWKILAEVSRHNHLIVSCRILDLFSLGRKTSSPETVPRLPLSASTGRTQFNFQFRINKQHRKITLLEVRR